MTTERIDVLAVMERARMGYEFTAGCEEGERQMRAARAAVAELIEVSKAISEANGRCPGDPIAYASTEVHEYALDWSEEVNATLTACDRLDEALARVTPP